MASWDRRQYFALQELLGAGESQYALTDEELRATPVGVVDQTSHALLDAVRQQTSQPAAAAFAQGRLFVSGARLALSSNDRGVWQLLNPAGSGIVLYVVEISLFVDVNTRIRYHREDAPIGGSNITPFPLNQASPAVAQAQFRAENRGSSNPPGTYIPIEARATASAPYRFQGAIAIPPGQGYLAWVQAPGGLTGSADVAASVTWYGQDI